jgi:hypothetical protein
MREQLITKIGVRKIFTGIFERYGCYKNASGSIVSTAVFSDIKVKGVVVADHAWLEVTDAFGAVAPMQKGEKIMFSALVAPYTKNGEVWKDVGLKKPRDVKRCEFQ